ncbi:unnamed protein product [Closterium sp. NIES-64]|nr:unnamed protein product [Closterium sp. NIES-64]
MEVAHTSMIHAAAPHFLWPFAVQYAAHQLNLWPRVSVPETSPTLRWTGEVGDASVFSGDVEPLSAIRVPSVDTLPPQGAAPSGVSQLDPVEPVEVAVDSGPALVALPLHSSYVSGTLSATTSIVGLLELGGLLELELVALQVQCHSPRLLPLNGSVSGSRAAGGAAGAAGGSGAAGGAAGAGAAGGAAGAAGGFGAAGGAAGTAGGSGASRGAAGAGGGSVAAGGAAGAGAVGDAAGAGSAGASGAVSAASRGTSRPRAYFVLLLQQNLVLLSRVSWPLAVTDPSFESAAASTLVAELVDFANHCRLDYAASLVAESESVCPPSVGGECALGTDVLEDRKEDLECLAAAAPHLVSMLIAPEGDPGAPDIPTPRSYAEAIAGEYSSQWQSAMDVEMASWKSTGTYEVPPPAANIVSGMWIFRTFSPTPKMTTLRVLLHVAAQRDYELHSLDFSTAFLQGSLHEDIWLRRPPGFTGLFPPGTQWCLRRPVYGLRQAPRERHDTLRTTLAALGFAPSTADPSLFLRTDTSLPPFYILVYVDDLVFATADSEALAHVKSELQKRHTCTDLGELRSYLGLQITRDRARRTITLTQSHMVQQVLQRFGFTWSSAQATHLAVGHSLSALPLDESVESSGPYPELVGCLMCLMTCTRPDLAYPLGLLARYVALDRHRKVHWDAAKRVLRYLCSTSGMGARAWRRELSCSHWALRRFLG